MEELNDEQNKQNSRENRPKERIYVFRFADKTIYEMSCGISFKDALWEMTKYVIGGDLRLFLKCLKPLDDPKDMIELYHELAARDLGLGYKIEKVYIVDETLSFN